MFSCWVSCERTPSTTLRANRIRKPNIAYPPTKCRMFRISLCRRAGTAGERRLAELLLRLRVRLAHRGDRRVDVALQLVELIAQTLEEGALLGQGGSAPSSSVCAMLCISCS